jgi:hypothetical protein
MKSVVVEASTVAKAIELAWQKAEKPEEFFIRILQEHSSGFLGFGAQKAKIVFFFKNSQKSDSLFPVVLKQKEYANLFDNDKLKAPSQLNVVDNELNKNISLGQKKKQHPAQQQAKQKQNQPNHHAPRPAHQDAKPQHQNQAAPMKHPQQVKPQLHTNKTQVKLELPVKPVVKQEQIVTKEVVEKKIQVQAPRVQEVSKVVQIPKAVAPFLQKVTQVAAPQAPVAQLHTTPVEQVAVPRVIPKMKRRPLTGADQGVSGITRSTNSSLGKTSGITPKVVKDSSVASAPAQVVAKNVEEDKGNQE